MATFPQSGGKDLQGHVECVGASRQPRPSRRVTLFKLIGGLWINERELWRLLIGVLMTPIPTE